MLVMGKRKYPESIETPESFRPSLCHFAKWTDNDREGGAAQCREAPKASLDEERQQKAA
jgi:hypothetical protein